MTTLDFFSDSEIYIWYWSNRGLIVLLFCWPHEMMAACSTVTSDEKLDRVMDRWQASPWDQASWETLTLSIFQLTVYIAVFKTMHNPIVGITVTFSGLCSISKQYHMEIQFLKNKNKKKSLWRSQTLSLISLWYMQIWKAFVSKWLTKAWETWWHLPHIPIHT